MTSLHFIVKFGIIQKTLPCSGIRRNRKRGIYCVFTRSKYEKIDSVFNCSRTLLRTAAHSQRR